MKLTFRLVDLLWLTGYVAIAAWLASLKLWLLMPVWLLSAFGFEIGARSKFKMHLVTITLCGTVSGLAFSLAIYGFIYVYQSWSVFGKSLYPAMCLSVVSALTGLAIIYWLCLTAIRTSKVD